MPAPPIELILRVVLKCGGLCQNARCPELCGECWEARRGAVTSRKNTRNGERGDMERGRYMHSLRSHQPP
jgi:hypothetical protein